jgi:conjugative transposon TraK protein
MKNQMNEKYMIFNDLSKIRKQSNRVLYLSLILTFVATLLNGYLTYLTNESAKNNFYLLDNGQKLAAVRIRNYQRAVDILCEGHIRNFHQLFFGLEADMRYIKRNIEGQALYMGDHSIQRMYNRLVDQNYYEDVAKSGYSIEVEMDSVQIDYSRYPFAFRFSGKQRILKNGRTEYRNLITQGYLEETKSSPNNLNGLKIIQFHVMDNQDL